jgi:MoaA/NifB/PqqE/SkfB family radical SAM enzyme
VLRKKSDIEEIEMDLTGLCNLKCPLCTRNYSHAQHLVGKNIRHIDEIKAQLDTFPNLKRFFIAGAVSEPTMYKYFLEFIEYLNSRNISYELFTNGNTHKPEWWTKLGTMVPEHCKVAFTICGSTQELHETYRVGSNLQQILNNAEAYRKSGKTNDYIQHILFEYNQEDLKSEAMQNIIKSFNNKMLIDTEGIRRLNEYKSPVPIGVQPKTNRDRAIRSIFKNRPRPDDGKKYEIQCKSIKNNKVYINQWGQISACYIHAEFEKDYFEGDTFDYTDILNFKYSDCFLCEKRTNCLIEKTGLYFVC